MNCRERVTLKIKLNDAFRNYLGADRIGMGMETFMPWHPGELPIQFRTGVKAESRSDPRFPPQVAGFASDPATATSKPSRLFPTPAAQGNRSLPARLI